MIRILISAAVACLTALPAAAATVNINTVFKVGGSVYASPTCPGTVIGGGEGTLSCTASGVQNNNVWNLSMDARAAAGSIGVKGSFDVAGDPSLGYVGGMSTGGSVSQNYLDTLTFDIQSGTFQVLVDLAGSQTDPTPVESASGGGGTSTSKVIANLVANGTPYNVYSQTVSATTGMTPIVNTTGALGTSVFNLAIVDGKIDLAASLYGTMGCIGRYDTNACTAGFNFFNSIRFVGGSVFDDTGSLVAGATVTSASGFDYLVGLPPHNPSQVPVPASVLFLGSGLFDLGLVRRRRARR